MFKDAEQFFLVKIYFSFESYKWNNKINSQRCLQNLAGKSLFAMYKIAIILIQLWWHPWSKKMNLALKSFMYVLSQHLGCDLQKKSFKNLFWLESYKIKRIFYKWIGTVDHASISLNNRYQWTSIYTVRNHSKY